MSLDHRNLTFAEKLEAISPVWITPTAQHVPVGNLSVSHIRNILKKLRKGKFGKNTRNLFTMDEWEVILKAELAKREA